MTDEEKEKFILCFERMYADFCQSTDWGSNAHMIAKDILAVVAKELTTKR